ncbi:hypothetical protein JVU11DRAFT_2481 [Chiua virens]|nr:hypothetical protein JVU11DRAFT_2481 [Chiua virens]
MSPALHSRPDGRYLIGGCCDFRIWIWDADVIRRPSPDAPPPLNKIDPAPLPPVDLKPEVTALPPAMIPLPPSPNSLLGSILELPRSERSCSSPRPPSPRLGTPIIKRDQQIQTEPPPTVHRRIESTVIKALWKKRRKHTRVDPTERSDIPSGRLRSRFQRLVQGLSTKSGRSVSVGDGDHGESAAGPVEDVQGKKRGHDPEPPEQGLDDDGQLVFLCCYLARTVRHDQPV